ncbi:MAG: ATP-binding protein, partial [Bacteroidota bacterium]|nr:ATP-binding protein [Bacteroidota bacterium]
TYNSEFEKAQTYLRKAIELLEVKAPDSQEMLMAYLNMANNFCYQSKGDEAKIMLDKAEKIIDSYPNSSLNPHFLYSKTLYFITKQKNENALETINMGIGASKQFGQLFLLQMFYFNKYDVLSKLGKLDEAKNVLTDILQENILTKDASNRKTIYRELSAVTKKLGKFEEALAWSDKYSKISDSINQSQMSLQVNELETKFRTAEKEKELAQKKLEISKKDHYVKVLGIFTFLLLLSAIFTFFYFKNKRKLAQQREINLQQQLHEIEQEKTIKLTRAMLDGEERERQRVAKDLHDGLGGMLAGVKINLSSWSANNLVDNQFESFHKILNQLDHSVSELRNIARNLMPESLLNFGLGIALKDLCDFYMKENLKIEYQPINMEESLPLNVQLNIYRIVQELLSNAVKHSGATNILLQCSQSDYQFFITVEDNGAGIKKSDKSKSKSMGLKNLEDRVHYMKGHMEISTGENEGTSVNIELYTNVA